jgi:serpin B
MMRRLAVLVVVAALVGACGTSAGTPSPSASPSVTPSATASATLAPSSGPTPAPTLGVGSVAVTVSDRLRVRSEPRVSDDSIRYEPLLPLGTELRVIGGPVDASGYTWWQVETLSFALQGATSGWVAMADHNGDPWIALAGNGGAIAGLEVAMSAVARARPDPSAARSVSDSVNAFGLGLYRELLGAGTFEPGANAVFSPASIALALAMARAGARGDTAAQMDDVLGVGSWDELAAGLNALDQALASRNATWTDYDDAQRAVALRIANASFGQRGWTIEPDFLDAIAAAFGSGLQLVDYIADPGAARQTINAWVSLKTGGRIPELLLQPDVTAASRLFLVNAIYLKAEWEDWFNLDATEPAPFTRLDGSRVDVPTMERWAGHSYPIPFATGTGWQAVELRYRAAPDTSPLAMMLILPADLPAFERSLDGALLGSIVDALEAERAAFGVDQCPDREYPEDAGCYPYDVRLFMPRFSIESRVALKETLAALGMPLAFDPATADFTGINASEPLFIGKVIHQANIDVDEKGTEAAAATAVGMDTGGGPSAVEEVTLRLDRPFLFALRDVETGAVLFMGRVVDPSISR